MRQDIKTKKVTELADDLRLLVINHIPMAYAMAWRMRDYGVSLEDLRQEACLGLCEAAMRYDENMDCSFAAYASHWCRKMMLLAIDRYGTPMQLPPRERSAIHFYSLDNEDNPQEEDDERTTDNLLATPYREREDNDMLRVGQMQRIDDALRCLTKNEQQIIRQFYGLDADRISITEIANSLGFSKARASAIHRNALRKLDAELRKHPLVEYIDA